MRLLWDASGLTKRYIPEVGSAAVDALWDDVPTSQMVATFPGYAVVFWILLKKRNGGSLTAVEFVQAKSSLRLDIIGDVDFVLLPIDIGDVLAGIDLTERHNLNSAAAGILAAFLRYAQASGDRCLLIAADRRLLRAAATEGLATLNPELLSLADVPAFLAAL